MALGTATVMPRPIAAGVLGMARTIAAPGSALLEKLERSPAMIDTTTVLGPTIAASGGTASGATCGFTATTSAATLPILPLGLMRTPRRASALIDFPGCGSMTTTLLGGSLSASQPSSMAPPILPAPTSTSVPGMEAREVGFADFRFFDLAMTVSTRHGRA